MSLSAPTLTTKKNNGIIIAGMIVSGSRLASRIARLATVFKSLKKLAEDAVICVSLMLLMPPL